MVQFLVGMLFVSADATPNQGKTEKNASALSGGFIPGSDLLGNVGIQGGQAGHFGIQRAVLFAQALFHQRSPCIHLRLVC
jgi:hypothetical protein